MLKALVTSAVLLSAMSLARAQTDAQITLSKVELTAGDALEVSVTLNRPSPCATTAFIYFQTPSVPATDFSVTGAVQAGSSLVLLKVQLAKDIPAGDYTSRVGVLRPCPNYTYQKTFTVPAKVVSVKAMPDLNQYPTSAELTLSPTQTQFLNTKAAELSAFTVMLNGRLDHDSADLPALRTYLIQLTASAEAALNVTEKQYSKLFPKSGSDTPPFFADFRAQYDALQISLKAPIPGMGIAHAPVPVNLVRVQQLRPRAPSERLSDTWPPAALATWQLLSDNGKAYKYIRDSGRTTFEARLTSVPPGARVSYKKLIDDKYDDFSGLTDVSNATFELATWMFKFHKDGCPDPPPLRVNPYQDSHPNITAEFTHCASGK